MATVARGSHAALRSGAVRMTMTSRRGMRVMASAKHEDGAPRLQASRRILMGAGLAATSLVSVPMAGKAKDDRTGEVRHSEKEWMEILGEDRYRILRQEGTEFPRTSPLNNEKRQGTFVCAGCGSKLFDSSTKYNSGTGWPSFYESVPGAVDETADYSLFMLRTEVRCHTCKGHLGHVFDDGPPPTGLRYCMNGLAMKFEPSSA